MKKIIIVVGFILIAILCIFAFWKFKHSSTSVVCGFNHGSVTYYTEILNEKNVFGHFEANGCDMLGRFRTKYFIDFGTTKKEVSKEEFYNQINQKNKNCNNCLKVDNLMIN